MKNRYAVIKAYDFSKLGRELTEDELYIVNGGKQIENSDEAVANAQIGDTLKRKDGTIVTINQGDIIAAQKKLEQNANSNSVSGNTETTSGNASETSNTNTETEQNNNAVTITDRGYPSSISSGGSSQQSSSGTSSGSATQSSSSSGNSTSNGLNSNTSRSYYLDNTSAKVDEENQIISFELSDPKGAERAFDAFYIRCDWGYTLIVNDAGSVVRTYTNENAAKKLVDEICSSNGDYSKLRKELKSSFKYTNTTKMNQLIGKENEVKCLLSDVMQNPKDYKISVYERRALNEGNQTDTVKHSLYVITNILTKDSYSLSFNGTVKFLFSKGAWGLNTETDINSLESFEYGNNSYDMSLLFDSDVINVEKTAANIIDSINSSINYYLIDHVIDLPGFENCNTALYNTVDINSYGKF